MARRTFCPVCNKAAGVTESGAVMQHGRHRSKVTGKPEGEPCAGTGRPVMPPRSRVDKDRRERPWTP